MTKKSRKIAMLRTQELERSVSPIEEIIGKDKRDNALQNSFERVSAQYSAMCAEFDLVHQKILEKLENDEEVPRGLLEQQKAILAYLKGGIVFSPGQLLPPDTGKIITRDTGAIGGNIEEQDAIEIATDFQRLSEKTKNKTFTDMQDQFLREEQEQDENTGD